MMDLIVNKISKTFDKKTIVRDISLNIQKGEMVGLLRSKWSW